MRILIYNWRDLAHPKAGGAEVYTDRVAGEWVAMGHQVTLFCSAVDGLAEYEQSGSGYSIVRRGSRHSVYREAKKYWMETGSEYYDLVVDEVNTRPFGCPKYVGAVPVLALVHQVAREVWFYETIFPVALFGRFFLEPYWLRGYRDVPTVTVSASSRESLHLYGLRNVTVVPEGFDVVEPLTDVQKEAAMTLIFVGRLSRNKRPHHALKVHQIVRKTFPDVQLWMIGSGPMEKRLRRKVIPGLVWHGRVSDDDKRRLMARATLLLATSVREGWGLAVSEAAAMGTPAAGYDVAGLRDSVLASGGIVTRGSCKDLANGVLTQLRSSAYGSENVGPRGVVPWSSVAVDILDVVPVDRASTMGTQQGEIGATEVVESAGLGSR